VLAYFAMMSFAFLAVAALVIDLGFAVLARRQMQTATNAAAIEGLKWRDAGNDVVADQQRRANAGSLLQSVFLDTDSPFAGPRNFGAGPVLDFTDEKAVDLGNGFKASETLVVPTDPPTPQINPAGYSPSDPRWPFRLNGFEQGDSGNNPAGDMVSGTYTAAPANPANLPFWHWEDPQYNRPPPSVVQGEPNPEFAPDTKPPSVTTPVGNAFLVRMRRSNEGQQPNLGLSSGPTIPYLFGRGSLLAPQLKGQGITVRATSIANAVPAMTFRGPQPNPAQPPSLLGIAFDVTDPATSFWQGMAGRVGAQINPDGTITPMSGSSAPIGEVVRLTFLTAPVAANDSTINVVAPDGFPVEPFQVLVGSEQMGVTGGFGITSWTVERGINGTTAAAHAQDDSVAQVGASSFGQTITLGTSTTTNRLAQLASLLGSQSVSSTPLTIYPMLTARVPGYQAEWIVAFGLATMTIDQVSPQVQVTFTRGDQVNPSIQTNNGYVLPPDQSATPLFATAVPSSQFGAVSMLNLDQDQCNSVLGSLLQTRAGVIFPLRAPALVRSE
jgi:Putative Flp pilus-assembly TadE/G-like